MKTYIFGPNLPFSEHYRKVCGPVDAIPFSRWEILVGVQDCEVLLVGDFRSSKDWLDLFPRLVVLQQAGSAKVKVDEWCMGGEASD